MNTEKGRSSGKVAKAGMGYVIGNYLLKGITFLSAPIFTRLLSTADFGLFSTYIAYMSIFYIVLGLALNSCLATAKYKFEGKLESFVSSIIVLILLSTCIWTLLANVFFFEFEEWFGFDRLILNCLIFHALGDALFQVFSSYVSLSYRVGSFVKMSIFNAIVSLLGSIVLVITVFSEERYLGRIIGSFIPMGIIAIFVIVYFFRLATPRYNSEYWKFSLKYSLPIIPHGISQVILSTFDRIMVKNMVSSDAAGLYSFSYTVSSLFTVAFQALDKVWRPWGYEKMHEKDYEAIKERANKYTFGMAMFAVIIIMVSPEIIKVLGDRDYWESASCVVPVIIGSYFIFLYSLPSLVEFYHEKTGYIAIGSVIAAVMNIILNYIFIPVFGYVAAAYTTMITYGMSCIFHYYISIKVQGFSIYDTKKLIIITLILGCFGTCALLLEEQWYIRWIMEAVICFGVFCWADYNFGVRDILKHKLKR